MSETTADMRQDAAARRLKARYRAEARFRAYGVIAIALAVVALGGLLVSIGLQAVPAFTEHALYMSVEVTSAAADPEGRLDAIENDETLTEAERERARESLLRRGDYNSLIREALGEMFPEARADRRARRELYRLVSEINAARIARQVAADPELIGQTIDLRLPIDDEIDLYLKNARAAHGQPGTGAATPSGVSGEIEINSQANDFADLLQGLRARLASEAERFEAEADRLERASAPNDEAAAFEIRRLRERAADYRARTGASGASETLDRDTPSVLVFINGGAVLASELDNTRLVGETIVPLESAAAAAPGDWRIVQVLTPAADRRLTDRQIAWAETLVARGLLREEFNATLFANADSRDPELAGVRGALLGSLMTMFVTMALAVPIAVGAAIYLEEFAPKNRFTDLVEVNINNLAAVPSIVFGLLGLAVFINFFGLPRSSALVGGMVLALMTLPTVIISTRAALSAVPPSIRSGALAVGASKVQAVFHHVLPLALPGILTGSIIGLAQALGETAPLLMIGMVAFAADAPSNLADAATVLPVQVFIWSSAPERAFAPRTSAAIMVLLALMVVLNLTAVVLRRRFERRW